MKSSKKRNQVLLVILILSVVLVGLTGCQQKKELATIRYGGQLYPEEYLLKGDPSFWTNQGINVEHTLFSSGAEGNQALIAGNVDINIGSDSKVIELFGAMPGKVVIIATAQRGDRYSTMIKADATYTSWEDLKGKKIGIRNGTGAEQVVRRFFEKNKLNWEDYEWVNMKIEDMTAALTAGQIEAFTAWEPTPAIAEAQGAAKVMMSYGDIALTPVLIQTTEEFAKAHHDELVRFLAAHLKKAELIKSDPQKAAEIAAQAASASGSEVSPDAFKTIFERVDFSLDLDDNVKAAVLDTGDFLLNAGTIKEVPELKWDSSYLDEAKKLIGK
jgi:ABC-type nitrate/sulfonate/bicarbonate transport system substrate-binding protein